MGILSELCRFLPVRRKKIVFANFSGRGFGGSPRYIAEEVLREGLDYDLVWLVNNKNEPLPAGIRPVIMSSRQGRYELSTARVIVNNVKHKLPFEKKSNQYYIQTWHGDFALKFIEKEVEDKLDPGYVYESKTDSRETDLILSGSRQFSEIVRESFWYDGEIFECGVPSNDSFFNGDDTPTLAVRNRYGLSEETRIALYAPTFRDSDSSFDLPDFLATIDKLEQVSGEKWVILVRFHPNDLKHISMVTFSGVVLDGSMYPDPQDIAKAADLLITDYSSIMYDFALQHKPVILFSPDIEQYQKTRGLRSIYWEVPFPLAQNERNLSNAISQVFEPQYQTRLDSFLKERICSYDDGHASERVVARIKEVVTGTIHGRTQHNTQA